MKPGCVKVCFSKTLVKIKHRRRPGCNIKLANLKRDVLELVLMTALEESKDRARKLTIR